MTQKSSATLLQLGHDGSYAPRSSSAWTTQTSRRAVQSAKEQRDRHFSVHHVRQMNKLTVQTTASSGSLAANGSSLASPKSVVGARSSASSVVDAKKQLESAFKIRSSTAIALAPVVRPISSGAFRPRKIEPTRFRYFYDRGDLPVRVNFAGAVRKLQWQVDVTKLEYNHYLPLFMEGLRELDEPYQFLALHGMLDMLERGENRVLASLALLVLPMKQNLMTRHTSVLCVQMKVLQKMVRCCPYVGEALVPYYRQLLSVFNLFITKRTNCGDAIDYGQRRHENLGDLIVETLNLLESHGGPDAFVNIKYMIPTYETCMQQQRRR